MDSYFPLTNLVSAVICFLALLATIFFIRKSRSHQETKTTASSSLTVLSPPSLSPPNWIHHVFPSFHGADVRTNFLSHVVKEFRSKGIDLFIDNDIERSKSIGPELKEAIRGSRIAIVMLSKNYASSTWCLNELVEIIKCRQELSQTVMSIFYQVDPTDVKKQSGEFGKVFRKTCKGKKKDELQRWKHALTEVAQIAGYHSSNWETEAEMIEDIAADVSNKLNTSAPSSDFDGLVGMESHMKKMRPLLKLDSNKVRKIGIWGPPGIGKSTIARSIFNQHSRDFQLSVFIDNIKRKYAIPACSDDYTVKLDLQKQFMSQLTNETGIKIPHLGVAKDRLKDKKVLIVLDDVDHLVQVEAMAKETSWFGPGSRIIITTQDQNILKASGIHHIHRVNCPTNGEALQMFCMYAFGQKRCKAGFSDLAWEVISLVGRLPLGLRVMGSYFRGMSEQDFTEALPKLRTHLDRNGDIANILKFSYDALCDEDKSLFLHVSCFFNGESVDIVEGCLANSFLDVRQGLRVLAEKSLISMESKEIRMAELLVQLGRKIVREHSVNDLVKRLFFDDAFDTDEVLGDDKTDSSSVIAYGDITFTSERAFERLYNLQFLRIRSNGISPLSINYISRKLRVLICFNPKFLVMLDMRKSKLEKLWEENKPLNNLKWMDLSASERLKELPDLSTATNLNDLNLSYCTGLVKLPFSIGSVVNLRKLNLIHCSSLVKLPSSIGNIVNLQELDLSYCSKLVELPSSIWNIFNLEELKLSYCSSLVELPSSSVRNLSGLLELQLQNNCSKLEVVGTNINLESIGELDLSRSTDTQEVDPLIGRISRLQKLVLCGMKKLESLPLLPDSLLVIDAINCESLERLDCSFPNPGITLYFENCLKLNQEARDLIIQSSEFAIIPAEEVPRCFTHRSYGSSVTVKLNQNPHVGASTKFKAGVICDIDECDYPDSKKEIIYCRTKSGGNTITTKCESGKGVYLGHLYVFKVEVETEKVTSTELVFEFEVDCISSCTEELTWEIKECGVLQLL
ncbi:hypothetical protein N665_0578s0011 [Sinapis alba]|nr:hypothetical protein N665_0578s0011 [Sinapis alba]